jgi:thiosulfate reductase cytochrome b subunit
MNQNSHPVWLRITHWLNVVAVVILIMSGWRIYNAAPVFEFIYFPRQITLGGWLAGALQWHFAAMWLLFFNGLFYLGMNIVTRRVFTKFTPLNISGLFCDMGAVLKLRLTHNDPTHYNMIQKFLYLGIIAVLTLMVLSGLVMWKPVQFPVLRTLLGDYDVARIIHFVGMSAIVGFVILHVAMVAIVPRTLKGMITGHV